MRIERKEISDIDKLISENPNKEISNNSDLIIRHILNDSDHPTWKSVIGKHIKFKYNYISRLLKNFEPVKKNIDNTDLLIPFMPCRSDYQEFIFPISDRLSRSGVDITVLAPHERYSQEVDKSRSQGSDIDFFGKFFTKERLRMAKTEYTDIENNLRHLSKDLSLSFRDQTRLLTFFQNLYIDKHTFLRALQLHDPSVIYSIHFIGNPGYLSAIREYKRSNQLIVILIQHGAFESGDFHDFNGADEVILWGKIYKKKLNNIPHSDAVDAVSIGNPKLQIKKNKLTNNTKQTQTILFASSPADYNTEAISILLDSVEEDWNLIFKPHPSTDDDTFKQHFRDQSINPSTVMTRKSIYKLIMSSDVVVGTVSTTLLEAIYLGTPSIQLFSDKKKKNRIQKSKKDRSEFMMSSSNALDLNQKLKYILSDKNNQETILRSQQQQVQHIFGNTDTAITKITNHLYNNYLAP